jgi:hypothetical protein
LGLLLDSIIVPAWEFYSIERILELNCMEICLIVVNQSKRIDQSNTHLYKNDNHHIIYRLFYKLDYKLFHRDEDAFLGKDLQDILVNIPILDVKTYELEGCEYFEQQDVEAIRNYQLDILIKLGFDKLQGEILSSSKYGVWGFSYSDIRLNRREPAGYWEVVEGWPEIGCVLYMMGNKADLCKVLFRSWFMVNIYSLTRNQNLYFWAITTFLSRQLDLFYRLGERNYFSEIEKYDKGFNYYDRMAYQSPSKYYAIWRYFLFILRVLGELLKRIINLDQWCILFDLNSNTSMSFCNFKYIVPPKDRFWADPSIIQVNGENYVFLEEYIYKNKKAHISVMQIDKQGNHSDPIPVLSKEYHLSYPCVFEYNHKYYMVPETAQNETIDLYECVEFPTKWSHKLCLMRNVRAVDTTLFYYHNKWWLFTAMAECKQAFPQLELFLFYSDDLFSDKWIPHQRNPIVSDMKRVRPAGNIFCRDGRVYRPSQDCSRIYGYGFDINEIIHISEDEYLEQPITSVRPNWDNKIKATHTFSQVEQLTVIDCLVRKNKIFYKKNK